MRPNDPIRLALVVVTAAAARVGTLWLGRPEFTGWLNHAYYYFVQVRGLVERGELPYPDMPLLFHLYALVARGLAALGVEPDAAIVAATRLVMCVVPALLPIPVYGMLRRLAGGGSLGWRRWLLVWISGFLPLSLGYLPEFLQKNTLGLLLLAVLMLCTQRWLERRRASDLVGTALVALAIVLTHYGTGAATVLYGVALCLAAVPAGARPRQVAAPAALVGLGATLAVVLVHLHDPARSERLLVYARESLRNSPVGALVTGDVAAGGVVATVVPIAGAWVALYLFYRQYARRSATLPTGERVFWLANILFCALLLLPVLDARLTGRLALFVWVPLVVLLGHVDVHAAVAERWKSVGAVAAAAAVALLGVGELVSARVHNARHATVLADLRALEERVRLGPDDLVVTRTGADHVCNWLFRVKAGVITSLRRDDFDRYRHVYVLDPAGGPAPPAAGERSPSTARERYLYMRSAIPRPAGVEPLFRSESFELWELEAPPPEWSFSADGRWLAYTR